MMIYPSSELILNSPSLTLKQSPPSGLKHLTVLAICPYPCDGRRSPGWFALILLFAWFVSLSEHSTTPRWPSRIPASRSYAIFLVAGCGV